MHIQYCIYDNNNADIMWHFNIIIKARIAFKNQRDLNPDYLIKHFYK